MNAEDFFLLGKIVRTHGVKGHLYILLDADHPQHYKKLKEIFLKQNDTFDAYALKEISITENIARILLQNVDDMTKAEQFLKQEVFLPLTQLPKLSKDEFYFHELVGATVQDNVLGNVGIINQFFDLPGRAIAQVLQSEKEILIPLNKEFIENFNRETKTLHVNLPEGLVDIYLDLK